MSIRVVQCCRNTKKVEAHKKIGSYGLHAEAHESRGESFRDSLGLLPSHLDDAQQFLHADVEPVLFIAKSGLLDHLHSTPALVTRREELHLAQNLLEPAEACYRRHAHFRVERLREAELGEDGPEGRRRENEEPPALRWSPAEEY